MNQLDDPYMNEVRRFVMFKGIVSEILHSVRCHEWCVRHGIDIVPEVQGIEPMELFFLQNRVSGQPLESDHGVGDRIPLSDGSGFAYLFPRDLYQKILVFGAIPD